LGLLSAGLYGRRSAPRKSLPERASQRRKSWAAAACSKQAPEIVSKAGSEEVPWEGAKCTGGSKGTYVLWAYFAFQEALRGHPRERP